MREDKADGVWRSTIHHRRRPTVAHGPTQKAREDTPSQHGGRHAEAEWCDSYKPEDRESGCPGMVVAPHQLVLTNGDDGLDEPAPGKRWAALLLHGEEVVYELLGAWRGHGHS